MMKSSTSFGFSSSFFLFFFFIVASIVVYSEAESDCLYTLTFQTGTIAEAGTDSSIEVTISNLEDESVKIPDLVKVGTMPPGHDYFEKGNLDIFKVQAPCIKTPVCEIIVTSDGSGDDPGWYLQNVGVSRVRLTIESDPISHTEFEFKQWLAKDMSPYQLTTSRDECG